MSARLSIEVQPGAAEVCLHLNGELDLTTSVALQACLEVLDATWRRVIIDLAGVTFLDSTGIHELLEARERCTTEDRQLTVTGPQPSVLRVLEIAGLDLLLDRATSTPPGG